MDLVFAAAVIFVVLVAIVKAREILKEKQKMKILPGREPGRAGLYKRGKTVFTCMKQTPQPAPYRDNL